MEGKQDHSRSQRHFRASFAGTIPGGAGMEKVESWADWRLKVGKCVRWEGDIEDASEHVIRAGFHEVQSLRKKETDCRKWLINQRNVGRLKSDGNG